MAGAVKALLVMTALTLLGGIDPPPGVAAGPAPVAPVPAEPGVTPVLPAPTSRGNLWAQLTSPGPGPAQAVGAYAAGCLEGAVSLPPAGPGYQLLHVGRRRGFGHPDLIDYVRRLAASARRKGLGFLLVGDLSQVRGGPTLTGHRSHQTGLDVDLGYTFPPWAVRRRFTAAERESVMSPVVVDLATRTLTPSWQPRVVRLLELAASDEAVERVFVNPVVKRELCWAAAGAPWLYKIRPWWGHHDHFHVRLWCPEDSEDCLGQEPLDPGDDGCGEPLRWWFSDEARTTGDKKAAPEGPPLLPVRCMDLLPGPRPGDP